jgi:acyl-homoserine lactone acylase PvdQ
MQVSLAPGEITTPEFPVNLSAQYTVEVEAKKTIPFETLNCLLGMSTMPDQKCDRPSVIKASWTLTSGGKVVQTGTSDADDGGGWATDTIGRELGTFWLKKGQAYALGVQFSADGRALAQTDPHLKIEVRPDFYEGTMFTSYFLMRWCERVLVLGLLILAVASLKWLWQRKRVVQLSSD